VERGEALAVVGSSGSGKSTLLHLLGTLDRATSGKIFFEGRDLSALDEAQAAHFRNRELGFVFQFHHLLPEFTTVENVAMQAVIAGMPKARALKLAEESLERVGLEHRRDHHVSTLSGGERQRAAIARATLLCPKVLLADEPTGNLDEKTGSRVVEVLRELNREMGMTLIIVTHNRELAASLDRCLELRSGELYAQTSF
ncbi:MAG: ABC transporter ATP-binding protein, partial [Mailhella sp.]|nr:ABC transporter ATP-binding protein [Mailhella sp.]